jgi:hypothetical protein
MTFQVARAAGDACPHPALLLPAGAKVSKNPAAYNKNMIAMQRNDSVPCGTASGQK